MYFNFIHQFRKLKGKIIKSNTSIPKAILKTFQQVKTQLEQIKIVRL
jgi:hypothetical protein